MSGRTTLWMWLRARFAPNAVRRGIDAELRMHIEMEAEALRGRGMARRDALKQSAVRFGAFDHIRRQCHDLYLIPIPQDRSPFMLFQDTRYAIRSLLKSPAFTLVAVLTLALGIGANTAIFSLVNAIVLQPLPFPESNRLISLWHSYPAAGLLRASVSPPNYRDYTEETAVFESLSAFTGASLTHTGDGAPFRVRAIRASSNFFATLGVAPVLGAPFTSEHGEPGGEFVTVLTHELWQNRFGGDESILGTSMTLDGERYGIIGVMPPGFRFGTPDLYLPLAFTADDLADNRRGQEYLATVGRLADGTTFEAAQVRMTDVARRIDEQYSRGNYEIGMASLRDDLLGTETRPVLFLLSAAVGLVLLIACANVANLLFARSGTRQREIALRAALGADRGRILTQFLTESLVLGSVGGLAGIGVAIVAVRAVSRLDNINIPRLADVSIDPVVLAFAAGASLVTALLFGVGPAFRTSGEAPNAVLHEGNHRSIGGRSRSRVRRLLVTSEVALSLVLLVSASLMIKSFGRLVSVDPGFEPEGVLSLQVSLSNQTFGEDEAVTGFYAGLLERIRGLPGVTQAGAIMPIPMSGNNWSGSFRVEGIDYSDAPSVPNTKMRYVAQGYFETLRIPLKTGRVFTTFDATDSPAVVIVDERFVERYLPGGDPLTHRLNTQGQNVQIIGVVGNVRDVDLGGEINGHIYWPHTQAALTNMALMIRTEGDPNLLTSSVISEIQTLDPTQAPFDIRTMPERVGSSVAATRFTVTLLALFSAAALLLATLGIYGVLSYTVSQRTNEIGVRSALGALPRDVIRLVVKQGMAPALSGIALGVAGALATTRFLQSQLFGVNPIDAPTFIAVPATIATIALAACFIPAWRATRVSPVDALRE